MADRTFRCKLITPEARVIDAEVTYARVPLWDGKTGVMHHTSAFVGKLGFGELRLDFPQGPSKRWFIDGGFVRHGREPTPTREQCAYSSCRPGARPRPTRCGVVCADLSAAGGFRGGE